MCMVNLKQEIFGFWYLQAGYSSVAQTGIVNDLGLSVAQVRSKPF